MNKISSVETRSRRLFGYLFHAALSEDPMNDPGATTDNTLRALTRNLSDELNIALRAGRKAKLGDGFNPGKVAAIAARIAAHSYAIARNNGVLNDLDLQDVAERFDQ